jgi:hypothetical protein
MPNGIRVWCTVGPLEIQERIWMLTNVGWTRQADQSPDEVSRLLITRDAASYQ